MAGFTDTYENKIINHFLRNSSQTPDANLYAAAFTTTPADAGTGGVEVAAGDYARLPVSFAAASAGQTSNTATLTFTSGAAANWGTVVAIGIYNALTGGTLVAFGLLDTAKTVSAGQPFVIAAGDLKVFAPIGFTTSYRNKIIEHFLRNNAQTPDAAVYFGLCRAQPAADGTGGSEVTAGWYARKTPTFDAAASGRTANGAEMNFVEGAPTAGGTVTHGALWNALTAGVMILYHATNFPAELAVGATLKLPAGTVALTID